MSRPLTLAFLTGQSDPPRCALSPEQAEFLARLEHPCVELIDRNFPYRDTLPHRPVSLLRASWRNTTAYFSSRSAAFVSAHRASVAARIGQSENILFLAGSCGLELFNNLHLPPELERRCTLLCYGPVARSLPCHAKARIVQGSRDFISRAFFGSREPRLRCGHMSYLREPEFFHLCQNQVRELARETCTSISG
ncbi:MAG TPA: hypothetical protein VFT72_14985 [Opitutaceae bacterium]|nr:hypothetical protein [Opitutaceae bacterium]